MAASNRTTRVIWWLLVVGFLTFISFAALGLLRCNSGRQLVWNVHATARSSLISVPLSKRDNLWAVMDILDVVLHQFPLYYFGYRSSRLELFRELQGFGSVSAFGGGIAVHDHRDVLEVLESAHQPRGAFLGGRWASDQCFDRGFSIFESTGPEYTQMRQFLVSAIHGLSSNHSGFNSDVLPPQSVPGDTPKQAMDRAVARNLWFRFFGEALRPEAELALLDYCNHEVACRMSHLNQLTGNVFVRRMPAIRSTVMAAAKSTKVGAQVIDRAVKELKKTPQEAQSVLQQILDGLMYEGLLGVSHLSRFTLDRIQSHPHAYLPMWHQSPTGFLTESARLDPPVTSVTSLLKKAVTIDVASGFLGNGFSPVRLDKGTPVQLIIANANIDPAVFGGPARSPVVAQSFDPKRPKEQTDMILSWNGLMSKVDGGTAVRGCPGMKLSFDLAHKLVAQAIAAQCTVKTSCHFGEISYRNEEPWYERVARVVTPAETSAFSEADSAINNELAFGIVGVAALFCIAVIKFWHGYGHMSGLWCQALTALFGLCVGKIYRLDVVVHHSAVTMAVSYTYMSLLVARHLHHHHTTRDMYEPNGSIKEYIAFTSLHWMVWVLAGVLHLVLLVCEVQSKAMGDDDYPFFDFLIHTLLLLPCGLLPVVPMALLALQEPNPTIKHRMLIGPVSLLWIAANSFWPSLLQHGLFAPLYTCLANIPPMLLMIRAVTAIDERLWLGKMFDVSAMQAHINEKMAVKVSQAAMTLEEFTSAGGTANEFVQFDTNHDGLLDTEEFMRRSKSQQHKVKAKSDGRSKIAIRVGILTGFLLFGAALLVPTVHEAVTGAQLCFFEMDDIAYHEACLRGADAMGQIDRHTRSLYRTLKVLASPRNATGLIDSEAPEAKGTAVTIPTYQIKLPKKSLVYCHHTPEGNLDARCGIPTKGDNTDGLGSKVSTLLFAALRNDVFYHLVDISTDWLKPEEVPSILEAGSREELRILELYPWDEMQSDEAISRFAFAGIAAHRTQAVHGDPDGIEYKNAWAWMSGFEVRPGFEVYGVDAYFDKNATLVKMFWAHKGRNVTKADKDWDHVKWAFKCSVLAGVTVKDHLVGIHFMASNFLTTSSIENLNPQHPIRRLIRPHTFGAIEINLGAVKTLAVEGGTAHRASALTWKGLQDALGASYKLTRYISLGKANQYAGMTPTIQADAKKNEPSAELYPYGRDADAFFAVVSKAVKAYVDVYYKDDQSVTSDAELAAFWDGLQMIEVDSSFPLLAGKAVLVDTLSTFIMLVTGIHNQVGNVADYLINPTFASAKVRPGATIADIQGTFQGLNIGLMTSQVTPRLLNDFKHLLLDDEHLSTTSQIFDEFQVDLRRLSTEIDALNEQRRFPCNAFNPKTMVAAVSI